MNAEGDQRVREIEARYREKERRGKVALAIMFAGFILAVAPLPHGGHGFLVFLASIVLGCIYETWRPRS